MQKIAVVTKDEQKVSAHFGMAPLYRVFSVEDGNITTIETREKPHHKRHPEHHNHKHESPSRRDHHDDMFAPIADCQVLICGGMGGPAHAKAQTAGFKIILTGGQIESVVQAYLNSEINSDPNRIHIH